MYYVQNHSGVVMKKYTLIGRTDYPHPVSIILSVMKPVLGLGAPAPTRKLGSARGRTKGGGGGWSSTGVEREKVDGN